jgi:hypothetical protein
MPKLPRPDEILPYDAVSARCSCDARSTTGQMLVLRLRPCTACSASRKSASSCAAAQRLAADTSFLDYSSPTLPLLASRHELMHDYLPQGTSSETPINSFVLNCRRRYAVRQTAADFPSRHTFQRVRTTAWSAKLAGRLF